jgi:hypothetical protein
MAQVPLESRPASESEGQAHEVLLEREHQVDATAPVEVFSHPDPRVFFKVVRLRGFGTNLFEQRGKAPPGKGVPGPKHFMQQDALLLGCRVQVVFLRDSGKKDARTGRAIAYRSFACYPSWDIALPILSKHKHWDEIVVSGQPCKGFLDLDGDAIPEGETVHSIVTEVERWVVRVFELDYGVSLPPESFVWMQSKHQEKLSLHLVINSSQPQLLFESNMDNGVKHLAQRVKDLIKSKRALGDVGKPLIADLVDMSVYSTDREFRPPGCAKIDKPQSFLEFLDEEHTLRDGLVTCLAPKKVR